MWPCGNIEMQAWTFLPCRESKIHKMHFASDNDCLQKLVQTVWMSAWLLKKSDDDATADH